MKFRKVITALGVSGVLTMTLLMGVSPAKAEDRCVDYEVRKEEVKVIEYQTREQLLANAAPNKYIRKAQENNGSYTFSVCYGNVSVLIDNYGPYTAADIDTSTSDEVFSWDAATNNEGLPPPP